MIALKIPKSLNGYVGFTLSKSDQEWLMPALEYMENRFPHDDGVREIVRTWSAEMRHQLLSAKKGSVRGAVELIRETGVEAVISRGKDKRLEIVCVYRLVHQFTALLMAGIEWTESEECLHHVAKLLQFEGGEGVIGYAMLLDHAVRTRAGFMEMNSFLLHL